MHIKAMLVAAAVTTAIGGSAQAQEWQSRGVDVRLAPGLVWQGGIFGDDDPESTSGVGLVFGVQVRGQTARRTGFSFEAVFQPIGVRNPHFDETLRTLYLLVGPEIGRRMYVRPTGGVALQSWSGTSAETGLNLALAFGVAVGHRHVGMNYHVAPEFIVRCSASPGAASWMLGIQLPFNSRVQ